MSLRVVGQHKGSISLDLDTATVLDLKEAVSRDSGLPVAGLKLLAGGKHLKDDSSKLAQCGVSTGKTIMVLRQDLSEQVQAEARLTRRTEETAQAASMLSARAARDMNSGGRGNAWGRRGREGRGGRGRGQGDGGREGGRNDDRREIELTNQDGEAMAIPAEDSAALMEGMMLHRQGLACVARARAGAGAAAASTAAVARGRGGALSAQKKKARHPPLLPQKGKTPSAGETPGTTPNPTAPTTTASTTAITTTNINSGSVGKYAEEDDGADKEALGCSDGGISGRGGRTQSASEEKGEERVPEEAGDSEAENFGQDLGAASEGGAEGRGGVATMSDGQNAGAKTAEDDASAASGGQGVSKSVPKDAPKSAAKGKGRPKPEASAPPDTSRRVAASAADRRLAHREALALLMRADEAFRRCDPKYLECVDNYAYLCLDVVWLLFLMKDMSNLDLASRMLGQVERGFRKAHGPGLERLAALKGEHCAENLLYVRLHLLQGVVAFLQGDSGKASGLLIRASGEAKALKPNPALASRLMHQWRTLKFESLERKVALLALRAGRNDLDAAWQYLESLRQRQDTARKERRRRIEQRRFGLTADKSSVVNAALVDQLVQGGFSRPKAVRALRRHNNDAGAALASLTASFSGNPGTRDDDEALAVLQSLGVPPEAARDVLGRAGTLCDALRELGINAPPGMVGSPGGEGAAANRATATEVRGGDGGGGGSEGKSSDENEESEEEEAEEEPTPEEKRLFDELAADRGSQDNEGYLDITLEDEADAADMYLHLCRGSIPAAFDFAKVRAGIAAAAVVDERASRDGK